VHRRIQRIQLGEDLPRGFGPGERLGIVVVLGDVAVDRGLEVENRVKAAVFEPASGQGRKEGLVQRPAGSFVWHIVGLQRSVREWAIRQGWRGRPVRQEQAQGILVAALGILAARFGYGEAKRAS
jgi:hypothetical protein